MNLKFKQKLIEVAYKVAKRDIYTGKKSMCTCT